MRWLNSSMRVKNTLKYHISVSFLLLSCMQWKFVKGPTSSNDRTAIFFVCSRSGDWLLKLSAQKHTFDHRDFKANNKMMPNALESRNISHRFQLFEMNVFTSTRWFLYSHNWLKGLQIKEITTYKAMLTSLFIAE